MSGDSFDGEVLSEKLSKLNNSQQSIESLSRWCVTHRKKAKQIVETWDKLFNSSQKEQCVSFLYLANDILQNSRRKGSEFVNEFWKVLPSALKRVCEKGDDSGKKVVSRLVDIWDERKVFGSRGQGLKDVMMGKEIPPPVVSSLNNQSLIKIIKKDAQAVRVKLIVGSMPEKVVMAFHAVKDEKNDEEATLKRCRDVLDNASPHGAGPPLEEIQNCIKELEYVEETRSALVLQLREALQDQEAKLDVIRNQLQIARRQIALPGTKKGGSELSPPIHSAPTPSPHLIPDVAKMAESNFHAVYSSGVSLQLPPLQPMTLSMPVQPTEEEKKKAAAAAMAAKLTASTSSAQMLSSVLSSLVAEQAASMNGGGPSHPPGFGQNTNSPMYPLDKRAKIEKSTPTESSNSDLGNNSYFAGLQQQMANIPQPQFSQPPNNHFTHSTNLMMPYGYNAITSLPPPPPPPLPNNFAIGLARPPTTQHQQQSPQQHSPASSGYYRPPGIGFFSQNNPPATPPMPRQ